jgi:hypothetical protein
VRGISEVLRSHSGSESLRALLWWPALSVIWWAAVPSAGVADVAGIGLGLAILGLVDAVASVWGRRRSPSGSGEAIPGQITAASPARPSAGSRQSVILTKHQYVDQ